MEISFIGQGLNDQGNSVGKTLIESFANQQFTKFNCLVAFASVSGLDKLSQAISASKSHITNFNTIVGVDQHATPKGALELLLSLNINTKIYYTSSHIIFHPKIYVFDSPNKCRIIIGSSNLTQAGLFQNIESSLMVEFDRPNTEGEAVLNQINQYFSSLFGSGAANIKLLSTELITELSSSGIVPDEADEEIQKERELTARTERNREEMSRIRTLFPTISVQRLPEGVRTRSRSRTQPTLTNRPTSVSGARVVSTSTSTVKGNLIWDKVLTASDVLYRQAGANTNPTGGLRLTKSTWDIDPTTYFRNEVFANFTWTQLRPTPFVEGAVVRFKVEILGADSGEWRLTVRHKPSGEAGQHNYTTSISWGELGRLIESQDLRGKRLKLYEPAQGTNEPFFIEII